MFDDNSVDEISMMVGATSDIILPREDTEPASVEDNDTPSVEVESNDTPSVEVEGNDQASEVHANEPNDEIKLANLCSVSELILQNTDKHIKMQVLNEVVHTANTDADVNNYIVYVNR